MMKNWVISGLLLLGSVGVLQAHPLDSPDIVYIDGQPCNTACQRYLAWSQRIMSVKNSHSVPAEAAPVASQPPKLAPEKSALRPEHGSVRRATTAKRAISKPPAPRAAKRAVPSTTSEIAATKPAGESIAKVEPAPAKVEPAPTVVSALPPSDGGTGPANDRAVRQEVATAPAPAEQVTAASPPPAQTGADVSAKDGATGTNNTETAGVTDADKPESRVILVIARTDIESVSDLSGRDIAIENQQSAVMTSIRSAIESAGVAAFKLNEGSAKPLDRLVGGEVEAAVVTLVSPEAAASYPAVPGYRIFRIPLSPGSSRG